MLKSIIATQIKIRPYRPPIFQNNNKIQSDTKAREESVKEYDEVFICISYG